MSRRKNKAGTAPRSLAAVVMGMLFTWARASTVVPEGHISVGCVKNNHVKKAFRMGKIRADKQFDIVFATAPLDPEPYPQIAFPGWHCDWTKGALTQGKDVEFLPKKK